MALSISEIQVEAVRIIKNTTPDVYPQIPFKEVHGGKSLAKAQATGSLREAIRGFHVVPAIELSVEGWSPHPMFDQGLAAQIRYSTEISENGWILMNKMAASDQARLVSSLCSPDSDINAWDATPHFQSCSLARAEFLPIKRQPGLWVLELMFVPRYYLA